MTFLTVSGITKNIEKTVLSDIHFRQARFQKLAIVGETGSGKSTLLKIIAGLVQADYGDVILNQHKVKGPDERLVSGEPGISYLSQDFELPAFLTVQQVLSYANTLPRDEALTIYKLCLVDHLLHHATSALSGGERQRIALARILTMSPELLLLDEPFSNLDITHKNILKKVIHDVSRKLKITCILVSHDPADILSWADEILVLQRGQIVQRGGPDFLYQRPASEYVAGLLGKYTRLSPAVLKLFIGDKLGHWKKKVLIRPENIQLVNTTKNTVPGEIKAVRFYGSYLEVDISVLNSTVKAFTDALTLQKGDDVFIKISANDLMLV